MFQLKLMHQQLQEGGLRLGDSCSISPYHGKKKAFTLNRKKIDLISHHYRPGDLAMAYIELPKQNQEQFHYRLELEESGHGKDRFLLRTLEGHPFWINGLAAKEAYIERADRLYIEDNKLHFSPFDLKEMLERKLEHPILLEQSLLKSELKILISGETGTGKSHLAQLIHEKSEKRGSFVAINLASYNPQLIESELFGHKKGSFTGATTEKSGAFSQAQFGTLFLDEIDSLPLDIQTKLLTFIDNKRFRKVGEVREEAIQTRLIFASGRPLDKLVEHGHFRKDLYFRLKSGHSVELSSLRNDIQKIKDACQRFALENGVSFSHRLIEFYQTLAWPGNLRQLLGHLDKKKILSRSTKLDFDQLDEDLLLKSSDLMSLEPEDELISMDQHKANYVKRALSLCEGNYSKTARKLQISEKTVRSLLNREIS
jgi:transcriptional regulator with GAF, ATPase, and Fis domain